MFYSDVSLSLFPDDALDTPLETCRRHGMTNVDRSYWGCLKSSGLCRLCGIVHYLTTENFQIVVVVRMELLLITGPHLHSDGNIVAL